MDLTARFADLDPEVLAEPYALFDGWRAGGPVVELAAFGGWAVTDYELACAVLRDAPAWSSDSVDGPRPAEVDAWTRELVAEAPELAEVVAVPLQTLLALDPPDHGRLRRALVGHLSAARVRDLAPVIDAVVGELVPALVTGEAVDVVAALCRPLPVRVTGHLLGLPDGELEGFAALATAASTTNPHRETRAALRARLHAELALMRRFTALLDAGPPEGSLLAALVADTTLTRRETLGLAREVIVAGGETTADLLSALVLLLAQDAALLARVRDDPAAREKLIEEALRLHSPFTGFWRRATKPVRLGEVSMPAGALLLIPFAALNRDPTRFADAGRLDLDREAPRRHLAFGHGIHFCVGAPLARLQSERVLAGLLPLVERVHLLVDASGLAYHPSVQSRGLRALPVRFEPRAF